MVLTCSKPFWGQFWGQKSSVIQEKYFSSALIYPRSFGFIVNTNFFGLIQGQSLAI